MKLCDESYENSVIHVMKFLMLTTPFSNLCCEYYENSVIEKLMIFCCTFDYSLNVSAIKFTFL